MVCPSGHVANGETRLIGHSSTRSQIGHLWQRFGRVSRYGAEMWLMLQIVNAHGIRRRYAVAEARMATMGI